MDMALTARMSTIKSFREQRSKALMNPPKFLWSDPNFKPYEVHGGNSIIWKDLHKHGFYEVYLNNAHAMAGLQRIAEYIQLVIIGEGFVESEYLFGDFAPPTIFLAEDKNKDVCTLRVWGLPENENTREMFGMGATLLIPNPETMKRLARNAGDTYWVDVKGENKGKGIFPVGKKVGMCGYCGKEDSKRKCGNCKIPYCGAECQKMDWKLKHKLVCIKTEARVDEKIDGSGAKATEGGDQKEQSGTSTMKPSEAQSKDEVRFARILKIRQTLAKTKQLIRTLFLLPIINVESSFVPRKTGKFSNPEPIFLKDMQVGNFYDGKVIELVVLEEPLSVYGNAVHFVVEDLEKIVANLVIYGLDSKKNKKLCDQLKFGAILQVFDPAYKIGAADGLPLLRVDDIEKVVFQGKKQGICRVCGKEGAKVKCEKCKYSYCGKKCQSQDMEVLKHELICEGEAKK